MKANSALRVLHYVATMRAGGAETLVRELLPRLQRRGIEIAAFSAYDPRLTDTERSALPYRLVCGKKRGRFDVDFGVRSVRAIRAFAPDIVHTHTVTGKYWGRASAIAANVQRIVHTEHSPQARLPRWELALTSALKHRTDSVITFSARTAAFVALREPVSRLDIIPNGIEVEAAVTAPDRVRARAALGAGDGVIVVGIIANLYRQKNHQLAIRALARLPADLRARVRLDFFGAGPLAAELQTLAAELNVVHLLHFWGFRADVRTLLAGVDLVLTVATIEAAPISLLEAMSAGIPIVGTPHHGTLDLVADEESGFITRDYSVDDLTRVLGRALGDEQWRARAGAAGRRRLIDHFDIEAVADRHAALYHRLIS